MCRSTIGDGGGRGARTDRTGAKAADNNDGRFTTEQFQVTVRNAKRSVRPEKRTRSAGRLVENETGKVSFRFEWSSHCVGCPLRGQCVAPSRSIAALWWGKHHSALQARRQEQKTDAFKERMKHRNGIEGTQSELVRGHGLRRARYPWLGQIEVAELLRGSACNVKRWLRREAWKIHQAVTATAAQRNGRRLQLNQKQGGRRSTTHLLAQTGEAREFKTRLPGGNDFLFLLSSRAGIRRKIIQHVFCTKMSC